MICILMYSLNKQLAEWKLFLKDERDQMLKEFESYPKEENILESSIEKYKHRYVSSEKKTIANYELKSISFTFSDESKSVTFKNHFVLSKIMTCISEGYLFEHSTPIKFSSKFTEFKEIFALKLYNFISTPNDFWHSRNKTKVHKAIAELFSIAGHEANSEQVKTWIKRAKLIP